MNVTAPFRTIEISDPSLAPAGFTYATVKSRALGRRADVTLFVPPAAAGAADLPIVVLLHGVYGSHWAWTMKGGAHLTAAHVIAAGQLPPVALVMPSDGLWGDGSGYVAHVDDDAERWIIEEVPALACAVVDGCTLRSPLLLAGLSMGGFGALRLAGKYPSRVTAAAGMSAVTEAAQFDAIVEDSRDGWSTAAADGSVLAALTGTHAALLPPLRIACGSDDPLLPSNRALHHALERAGIAHEYAESPGGHDWTYWTGTLAATLAFFGKVLQREGFPR